MKNKVSARAGSGNRKKDESFSNKNHIADKFIDLIENKISSVKINNQIKRLTLPDGSRVWNVRMCWEVVKEGKRLESKWEGFETAEEAIKDLLKKSAR